MPVIQYVCVRTSFEFAHKWKEAPDEVSYLRNLHRHIFHVQAEIQVYHDDRELEFIMVKHEIDKFVKASIATRWQDTTSCEQMAIDIGAFLQERYGINRSGCISVFEDDENGAKIFM